jgi:hypothetical protein
MTTLLRVRLLDGFRLTSSETPVTIVNTPRLQSPLAYRVLCRATPQPRRQEDAASTRAGYAVDSNH